MNKVYEIITDRIIEKLEQGTVPWHMPWSADGPKNLISDKAYRGINVFMLGSLGYMSPYWLTFKQAQALGGHVSKGEKGTPVVFWKTWKNMEQNDKTSKWEDVSRFVLRYYSVFNIEQCTLPAEEIPQDQEPNIIDPIPEAMRIVQAMPTAPAIEHGEPRAYYSPSRDLVNMPRAEAFNSSEEYYSTLFHELTHSTGHHSRLDRFKKDDSINPFGSREYSKEELIAEMGAAFLSGHCGIEDRIIDNSAAYINGWLGRLKNDPQLVVMAAAKAQKASDYILGTTFDS